MGRQGGYRQQPGGSSGPPRNGHAHYSQQHSSEHEFFSFASFAGQTETTNYDLIVDSGCTGYMIKDRELFIDMDTTMRGSVGNADASKSSVDGCGTVQLWVKDSTGKPRRIELKDAMFVPSYSNNLVSVKRLNDSGVKVEFGDRPRMCAPDGTVFPITCRKNLFYLQTVSSPINGQAMKAETLTRWHERLGHANKKDVAALTQQVEGMQILPGRGETVCEPCSTQKAKRAAVSKTWGTRATS